MAQDSAGTGAALAAARSALATRDSELASADRQLARTVCAAHAVATGAITRLADLAAQVEGAREQHCVESSLQARQFARFLIARQREAIDVVTAARAQAGANTVVLQRLADTYRLPHERRAGSPQD